MSWCLVLVMVGSAWAVTDDSRLKQAGISQFWTDDYKVFDQIYGRTSDRHLYGTRLPLGDRPDADAAGTQRVYALGGHFALPTHTSNYLQDTSKPAKTPNALIYNAFKPISKESDPETYDYLKHLEHMAERPPRPLTNLKSIQDILHAHEGNQHQLADQHLAKYFNPPPSARGTTPKGRQNPNNSLSSACGGAGRAGRARCPARSHKQSRPSRSRSRPTPVIRKIKTIITE